MRYLLFLFFSVSALHAAGKITHIRYVAHAPADLDRSVAPWMPTHWDVYIDGNRYRIEESGNALPRVWIGQMDVPDYHLLLSFFGSQLALTENCPSTAGWAPAGNVPLPPPLAALTDGPSATFAGLTARAFTQAATGEIAYLTAERMESPCVLGFPSLPLAFRFPEGQAEVWMVMEFLSASEERVDFDIPPGYMETTVEGMRELLPTMEPEK